MHPAYNFQSLAAEKSLGRVAQVFSLKRQVFTRWANTVVTIFLFLGALTSLVVGAYSTYEHYYRNGPAIIVKDMIVPTAAAIGLAALAVWWSVRTYRMWNRSAVLFDCGIAYRDHHGVNAWRWEEFTGIRIALFAPLTRGLNFSTKHEIVLITKNGRRLVLNDSLEHVDRLAGEVRKAILPGLCSQASEALRQGMILKFGPVEVNRDEGLMVGKNRYGWDRLQAANIQRGLLQIRILGTNGKTNRLITIPAQEIENLEVLLTIIDQHRWEKDNTSSSGDG